MSRPLGPALLCSAALLAASPAWADTNLQMGADKADMAGGLASVQSLIGRTVLLNEGYTAGRVVDVMYDPGAKQVALVLAGEGPPGSLAKSTAVPWPWIKVQETQTHLLLPMAKAQYDAMPSYEDAEVGNTALKEDVPKNSPTGPSVDGPPVR